MKPVHNILVIVDPTATVHPAVAKGAVLSAKFKARLDLFVCDTRATAEIRPWLEVLAKPLRDKGLDVTTEVAIANPPLHTALLERVKHTCADLVVKDTHQHTAAQRTILTNTDWELIRGCPAPLLLVKPAPWSNRHRVGAALDPGHMDDKPRLLDRCILDEAARVAQALNGEVHAIHTYLPAAMIASAVAVPALIIDVPSETVEAERKAKLAELTALTSGYQMPIENVHLEVGGVSEALCRFVQECEIDIMAMGAISRKGWKRMLIGSTAESVLERLPCDMLVVKSPNFSELLVL